MKRLVLPALLIAAVLLILPLGCGKTDGLTPPDFSLAPTPTPVPPCLFTNGWFFDTWTEGWVIGWTSTQNPACGQQPGPYCVPSALSWDATAGSPDPGSLAVSMGIPAGAGEKKVEVSFNASPSLAGASVQVCARIWLEPGFGSDMNAKVFVKDGSWSRLDGPSITLAAGTWNSTLWTPGLTGAVQQVGVEFATSGTGTAHVKIDSWSYSTP